MALQQQADDEDEFIPDEDFLDGQNHDLNPHKLKAKLKQLRAEKRRRDEYESRLKTKLSRLEGDLAAKREQVEGLKTNLSYKQRRSQDNVESEKKEFAEKAKVEQARILDQLSKVLYKRPRHGAGGDALETVLVSFVKPGTFIRYNLAFRIDESTSVHQMRKAATMYWNVSEHGYILKTLANSKCQRNLKVRDCFKHGDIAQLMLEPKKADNTEGPTAEELKAIMPKGARIKRGAQFAGYDSTKADHIARHNNTTEPMRKMGGIYFLLKLREKKPSEHVSKIKFRDFVCYTVLIVITVVSYMLRRSDGRNFFLCQGIRNELLREIPYADGFAPPTAYTDVIPSFDALQTPGELGWWMNTSLPEIIWSNATSSLGVKNFLVGYVRLRVQNVRNESACSSHNAAAVEKIPGARCLGDSFDPKVTVDEQQTEDMLELKDYWTLVTSVNQTEQVFRGPNPPWKHYDAEANEETHRMTSLRGIIDSYSAGGYSADYRMDILDRNLQLIRFHEDMATFMELDWFSDRTRLFVVSFTAYNFAYDMWVAVNMLQELLPGGALVGSVQLRPFKPSEVEITEELNLFYTDAVRCIIALYILIVIGQAECQHKIKNNKAGTLYFQYNGIMDYGMVTCIFWVTLWRMFSFQVSVQEYMTLVDDQEANQDPKGFTSSSPFGNDYQTIFVLEGLGLLFMMMRMVNLFRIFDHVFLLWRTIGEAAWRLVYFIMMFAPVVFFLGLLLQLVFGTQFNEFLDMPHTLLSVLMICQGELNIITRMLEVDLAWGLFFVFVAFIAVRFLMINVFITNVIDAYYITRITTTQAIEKWDTQRWLQWATPKICHLFTSALTGGTQR